MMVDLQQSR